MVSVESGTLLKQTVIKIIVFWTAEGERSNVFKGDQMSVMPGPSCAPSSTRSFIINQELNQFASSASTVNFQITRHNFHLNGENGSHQSVGNSRRANATSRR